jgi:aminoglycoside phosphotransferase (APT) family kinase protein
VHEWAAEVTVDDALARRLIGEQFPELALRSLRLLGEGWDTTVWLVDEEWVFRFPRRSYPVPGLENEIAYLPRLAPLLPLPIPNPTLVGEPSPDFRWPFYGAPFLPGRELADAALDDAARGALARPLAEFLLTLHAIELGAELPVDPVRRADMSFRVPRTVERLEELERLGLWTAPPLVADLLESARELPAPEPAATCHGDLHLRHLLVDRDGKPSAVIDWIDLSRNDPGVDLVLYWSSLPPESRSAFLEAYGPVSDEQLLRGRVLAVFLCGTLAVWGHHEGVENVKREAVDSLERTFAIMPSG